MNENNDNSYKSTKIMLDSLGWTILIICIVNVILLIIGTHTYYFTNNLDFLETTFDISIRVGIIETLLALFAISCCKYIVYLYEKK